MADTRQETRGFQTEVRQLLDLMIHSLYSNREILDRKSTRLNSSHMSESRMPSSA